MFRCAYNDGGFIDDLVPSDEFAAPCVNIAADKGAATGIDLGRGRGQDPLRLEGKVDALLRRTVIGKGLRPVRASYVGRKAVELVRVRLLDCVQQRAEFFERFEQAAGDRLPVLRGDLPNTDYTVGAISTPKETGVNRQTHDLLGSAEKLAACAASVSDYVYPADTLAEAYDCALLYDEHTWGMAQPIGPAQDACWSQKSELAYRAAALAHDVSPRAPTASPTRSGCRTTATTWSSSIR